MISSGELLEVQFQVPDKLSNRYPFHLPFLRSKESLDINSEVTFFVGENGMGKSTLIEAIAIASGFNAEGGTKNFKFSTKNSHSELHEFVKTSRGTKRHKDGFFLRSESFFNLATEIDRRDEDPIGGKIIDYYGGKSLHEQSHGESFWALFTHRFGGNGFYILDEPESAMSPTRQMAMLCRMPTHSPILIAYPNATVYEITSTRISKKNYKDTDLFMSYAGFVKDSDSYIHHLLKDGGL